MVAWISLALELGFLFLSRGRSAGTFNDMFFNSCFALALGWWGRAVWAVSRVPQFDGKKGVPPT